ncbi:immune-related, lectin-like receptor 4 [Pseudorasbora parva]|uniref:immune-related, lectin-like receptor 4 n=1 Tax=Pseudorasbora parva TaxID=51549 RepID=UPI00351E7725
MSEDVVYSEVVFVRRNKVDSNDPDQCQLGDSSQASQKTKPCVDCVRQLLTALCILTALTVLLTGGLIAVSYQYVDTEKRFKDLEQLHSALKENFTELSAVLQDMDHRQQNLSMALNNSACPKDWEYYAGKCYYFSSNKMNWEQSRDSCISDGGHLVIINSGDEQEFLMRNLKTKYKARFWIGLTDEKNENQWLWVDNTKLSIKYWIKSEPDNWKGPKGNDYKGEDCVIITPELNTQSWSDGFCSTLYRRICETRSSRQI